MRRYLYYRSRLVPAHVRSENSLTAYIFMCRYTIPHHVLKFIGLIHRGISKTTPRILCCMNGNYMHKIPSKTLSSEDHSGWGWEEGDPILLTFKSSLNQRHLIPCHKSFDIYIHIRLARGYPICQRNVKRHHKNSEDNIYKHIYIYNRISIYIYIYMDVSKVHAAAPSSFI